MHPYTIDTGVRKKVIIYIFIFSIVLSSVLTYFLEAGILSTKAWLQQFVWIDQVLKICDTVGVTTNFIGVIIYLRRGRRISPRQTGSQSLEVLHGNMYPLSENGICIYLM